ncbi:hypothetical protein SDC9_201287 [bioreactor metagenome]|uniref:Uncharacterized protein n=1 Tax=bioreactor metagenome TaxID=1076179 RepID=A0A645J2F8_9ZZZZ
MIDDIVKHLTIEEERILASSLGKVQIYFKEQANKSETKEGE